MTDPVWVTPNGGLLLKEQGRDSFRIPSGYSLGEEMEEGVSETESVEDPVIVTKSTCNPYLELRRPFRFSGHRTRIDWRALYGIDAEEVYLNTDLAALDRIVPVLCHGDLTAEDPTNLTALNFVKLFRLSQLTIEYLLYVQDTLANDYRAARKQKHQMSQHLKACRLRIKEQDQELRNLRRDLKQIKRHVQTYEVLATTSPFSGAFTGADENQTTEVSSILSSKKDVLQEFKALGNEKSEIRIQMQEMKKQLEELWKVQSNVHHEHIDETKKLKSEFAELTSMLSELNETKKENNELNLQKKELQSSINHLKESKEALTKQITSLESTIVVLKQEKEAWEKRSQEDMDLMSLLKNELGETKTKLLESTSRLSLSDKNSIQQKETTMKLEQDIENLSEEKETMQRLLQLQEEKLKSMESLKSKLRKEKSLTRILQQELDQLPITNENKVQSLQLTIRKLRTRIKELEATLQSMHSIQNDQTGQSLQPQHEIQAKNTEERAKDNTLVKDSWRKFIKRFPVVMSWNKALRSRRIHNKQDFKNLSPPIVAELESKLNYKINSMGVDSTNEKLDKESFKEALENLKEDINQHKETLPISKRLEYEDLVSGMNHHLDRLRPLKNEPSPETLGPSPKAIPVTSDVTKAANCSPKTSPDQSTFSPLSNGLLRGASRDINIIRSSTIEAITPNELTRDLSPPKLKLTPDSSRLWSVLNQASTGGSPVLMNKSKLEEDSGFSDYTSNAESASPKSRPLEDTTTNASIGSITIGPSTKHQEQSQESDLDDEYSLDFDIEQDKI